MRQLSHLLTFAALIGTMHASSVGDSYDQVIADKGKPVSRIDAGPVQLLSYADGTLKLRDGIVVSIKAPPPTVVYNAPPARTAPGAATANPAATAQGNDDSFGARWTTDFDGALQRAKSEHRRVFLFFTGSDWCGWCKKLNREILKTEEFTQYAQQKLVLVELDFPHQKAQSEELRAQNRMLAARFDITGYPAVVVLDENGRAVARKGYQEGGPGPFVSSLLTLGD